METKIKVKSMSEKNGWYNIKTMNGKEISSMIEKCPAIKKQFENWDPELSIGMELNCNLVEKGDKTYAWDVQEKKGNGGFQKKSGSDESFALSYAKDLACANIEAGKPMSSAQVLEVADAFFNWLQDKKKA